jgi:predicted pyridoxine 5'-phosphate oxidase superfamily flavin-nucleotide-binding protein
MSDIYSAASRTLQDQFDTRRLADRLAEVKVHDRFTADDREFIQRRDMFFLATVDADGQPTCSYKGGDPGFVKVIDDTTLVFPNYDGNGMYLSMGNLAETHGVGLLFIDFESQRRMRVDGVAQISMDDSLKDSYPESQFIVRVEAKRIYPNCPRYIHKYQLVERSSFVPRTGARTPIPGWKQSSWAIDVLPATDPARSLGK